MVKPQVTSQNSVAGPQIFDRGRIRRNRNRSCELLQQSGFLIDWAAEQLLDRLKDIKRKFPCGLQIGLRENWRLSEQIQTQAGASLFIQMDIAEKLVRVKNGWQVQADDEFLPFANQSLDFLISNLCLHTINDLPGALIQMRRALKPDGLFLAAMLGGETLHELRKVLTDTELDLKDGASPRVFPFADKQQMGALMQRAGYALPVIDSEILSVTYDSIFGLLHDVRNMGEGNGIAARDTRYPGRDFFAAADALYKKEFSQPDGKIAATFEVIFLIGWAPHESQQKPLRPGSAEKRLSDALQTEEIKTGEKAEP